MSLLYTFLPYLEDYILQINNLWLSDLVLCTTILVLHIGRIPPHNDNYNNNTSTGRTRRTRKKK